MSDPNYTVSGITMHDSLVYLLQCLTMGHVMCLRTPESSTSRARSRAEITETINQHATLYFAPSL